MEVRTGRAVKRMRATIGSPVADRPSTAGSLEEVSQLRAIHNNAEAAVNTAQTSLACGTHPWNTLCLDLQERILMHLPLQDLGRACCLGKAFRSAFQQRALEVEQGLSSAGVAAIGMPLLEGVGRVLQRYRERTDLATGCGPMRLEQRVWIDRCGTVTNGSLVGDLLLTRWDAQEPCADVVLLRRKGAKDVIETHDLSLCVTGLRPGRGHWAYFKLSGPTRRSSARLRIEAAHLRVQHRDLLGAMFIIAHRAVRS